MTDLSCLPVAVDQWGGAGDACASAVDAIGALTEMQASLRAAFPEHWRSVAADGFADRLTELLVGCARVLDAVEEVYGLARQMAEDVATSHPAAG
ncbi:hypothetical protein V2J52_05570 [Georgenia sp. MJ173]|uniref:hypothetical protein n=1 Tax=Georgenia sunbinii TaxID=3117728 RepID=UPI002F263D37